MKRPKKNQNLGFKDHVSLYRLEQGKIELMFEAKADEVRLEEYAVDTTNFVLDEASHLSASLTFQMSGY